MSENKKFIDIHKVFHEKNPSLYRWTPNFLIDALSRLVHAEEINLFIDTFGHHYNLEFVDDIISEFGAKPQSHGLENIPKTGGCVIAANHPLGGLDAIALIQSVAKTRPDIKFIVNDVLLQLENLKEIFTGVNKFGKTRLGVLSNIDDLYASGMVVMIFPAGLVSRRQPDGTIRDLEWKKSFISKAKKYNVPVIPTYIGGTNTSRFYSLANFRKKIGIQANIEMMLLPDEMYKQKGKAIPIIFGEKLFPESFPSEMSDQEIASWVKEKVYNLQN